MPCLNCGGPMAPLFTSMVCENECDLRKKPDRTCKIIGERLPPESKYWAINVITEPNAECAIYAFGNQLDYTQADDRGRAILNVLPTSLRLDLFVKKQKFQPVSWSFVPVDGMDAFIQLLPF